MNKIQATLVALSITFFVCVVWVCIFLKIVISDEAVPTLVNGITSATSVIVGFCGAIIGIMFREIDTKDNSKAKTMLVFFLVLLMFPITILWSIYTLLTMGWYATAVRYGLSGLMASLYVFASLIVFIAQELGSTIHK